MNAQAKSIAERLLDLETRVAQLEAHEGSPVRPGVQATLPADEAAGVRRPRKKGEESAEVNQEDVAA